MTQNPAPTTVVGYPYFRWVEGGADYTICPFCSEHLGPHISTAFQRRDELAHLRGWHPEALDTEHSPENYVDPMVADARRIILAIANDIVADQVDAEVDSFVDLHDYVDANEYLSVARNQPSEEVVNANDEAWHEWANTLTDVVDAWLRRGVHRNVIAVATGAHGMPAVHACGSTNVYARSPICGGCSDEIHPGREVE